MKSISTSFFPNINKEEAITLFKAFCFFFFVLASWYALRPVRNELAVQGGINNLPWLLTGVMLAMLIINPIYSWLVSKVDSKKIVLYIYSFFILNLILFLSLWYVSSAEGRIWTGRAFYIWCNVYSFFVVSVFWVAMINFFNQTDAKRFFGIISAGGSLGAFFGSSVARYFSTEICGKTSIDDLGPITLIVFSIFSLLIALYFSNAFRTSSRTSGQGGEILGGSSVEGIKNIITDPLIRNLGFYVILFTMLMTTSWMISLGIVEDWSKDPCERTAFFARIEQIVTPLTGIIFVASFSSYALFPTITTVTAVAVCTRIFEYGLNKPTRETLYTNLAKQDRYKSTVLIDTFIARSGDVIGGWFVRGLVSAGVVTLSVSWAALPFALMISFIGFKVAKASEN